MEKYNDKIACYLCCYLIKNDSGFTCLKKVYKYSTIKPSVKERNCNCFRYSV